MQLIILTGLQASGKSTFFRTYFREGYTHVSKDLLRSRKHKNKQQKQIELIEAALQAGRSVVVDNTNPTLEDREPLIRLGHHYGAEVIGYYFESSVSSALERNKQRVGKARVPPVAIYTTSKRLTRPTYAEGFDKLYYVRIPERNTESERGLQESDSRVPIRFEVRKWVDDEIGQ